MQKKIITKSAKETQELGKILAKEILAQLLLVRQRANGVGAGKSAVVLGLQGDLGGGKTTFLQGFAKGLGIKEKILSPTFIIYRKFKILNSKFKYFYHFDCYRLKNEREILELGFKKIISDPKNIVVIEWAEKIKKVLPKSTITIKFDFIDKNKREIVINF